MRSTASTSSGRSTAAPSHGSRRLVLAGAVAALTALLLPATALGSDDSTQFSVIPGPLGFGNAPVASQVPKLSLKAPAQAGSGQMNDFSVSDSTGAGSGWNITVNGDNRTGKSPVLKQYCPKASCGSDPGPGYIAAGTALPADSLIFDSSGASFTAQGGSTGIPPRQECDFGCFLDAPPASPTKIVSAASGTGMGTFKATGFSSSSVALAAPNAVRALPANEVYRVDLLWSLNCGP
jgi:hypothetical protein